LVDLTCESVEKEVKTAVNVKENSITFIAFSGVCGTGI
jgi:hypothetical protein